MKHQKQLFHLTTEQTRVFADRFRNLFRKHRDLSNISGSAMSAAFLNLTTNAEYCRGRIMYSAPLLGLDRNSDVIQIFQFTAIDRMQWIMGEYCDESVSGSPACENTLYPEFTPVIGINVDRQSIGIWWIWTHRCLSEYT
ncbi:uncharacterized protein LOC105447214 [Strongylocentrotus purpuratus]|uniref:Uncharacterized protein n=1 Tax=Strongylocentrotus purpuratus TaxID=7668 RepID=A0A7M7P3R6_STRPU|nr:uncharacterized protein LOC105447214 [Strongylocentrotus purpuratus]